MDYNITYRKKDKGWQYIITVKKDGKWQYGGSKQGFNTKALAKAGADIHIEEIKEKEESQHGALPEHKGLTFKYLSNAYKKHKLLYGSVNTVKHLTSALTHFKYLDNKPVEDITPLDIQNCVDGMIGEGLATSTVELYAHDIKMLFDFAITLYKIIVENPVKDITVPKKDKKKKEKTRALNKKELDTLLSRITFPKYYIASQIMSKSGLRIGELVGLTWDAVDFKKMQITVDKQWKETEEGVWGFGPPKSENSYRTIPAPPILIKELAKFKSLYPIHISNRILPYATARILGGSLAKLYKDLGFDISAHDLRHTYATALIANGMDFKTVAKLMGHDVEETIKTYSHVTSDMMENATNLINTIF